MVGVPRWLPIALLGAGAALIAESVWSGSTRVYLLVVFPVLSGTTPGFVLGVVLLIAGFFALPFLLSVDDDLDPGAWPTPAGPAGGSSGGVVIVGPVPFFFGSWRGASRRSYWVAAAVGMLLVVGLVLLLLGV